jgi:HemY protein
MRALFWLLALFSLAVLLAVAGRYNTGYALVVVPPWRLELSLNLLVLVLAAVFVFAYLLLRLVVNTLRMPRAVREFRARKRREKAAEALREALRLLFEGRFGQALKHADKAFMAGEAPGLAALVAARAARGMNNENAEFTWLGRAQRHDETLHTARLMTEAELHAEARRFDAALDSLNALQEGGQRHIAALRLALRVHRALGRWTDVLRVARLLEKHRAIAPEHALSLKRRAHLENLHGRQGDARQLIGYWSQLPAGERRDAQVAAVAGRLLIEAGDCGAAQRIIEGRLAAEWDDGLVALYGECRQGEAVERISRAEEWLKERPQDAQLLLTLGRLCRIQQLWGKAQSYLEASLALSPTRAAHLELAGLFDELQRPEDANRHYRAAAAGD